MDPIEFYKPNLIECEIREPSDYLRLIFQLILIFITIIDNSLVIVSVLIVKVLRQPRNYLILSLAIADILVGVFVLPFKILLTENCGTWIAGSLACYIWISGDVLCCTASILGLTGISLDCYLAILYPLLYRVHSTPNKTLGVIAVTWIFSLFLTIPHWAITNLHHQVQEPNIFVCIESPRPWHQIIGTGCSFFLPLFVMIFVYANIWRVLAMQKSKYLSTVESNDDAKPPIAESCPSLCQARGRISEIILEKKGCITMGIVVGVFVTCWLPFFTLLMVDNIATVLGNAGSIVIPHRIYDYLIWLGYLNSCANPFIYTMFNKEFGFAFKELLCLRCSTINSKIRHVAYCKQVGSSSLGRLSRGRATASES